LLNNIAAKSSNTYCMTRITLLICCVLFAASYGHAQTKAETAVAAVTEQLSKAMIDADSMQLVSLVHDKLSYAHSSGKTEDKAAFVSALASGRSDFLNMNFTDQKISVAARTAIVRHTLTGQVVDNGKQGDLKLHVLLVWAKEKGRWQLLARQAVRLP
jgi:hypothetical protein